MQVNRALGCRQPDPATFAAHLHASVHPLVAARLDGHDSALAPLPASADRLPPWTRTDQGLTGSCTWHALAIVVLVACLMLGTPLGFVPSMVAGYAATRAKERPDPSVPLEDVGADPEIVFLVAARYGVRPMKAAATPDGRFSDIWSAEDVADIPNAAPANLNDEPEEADLDAADATKILLDVIPHRIDPSDPRASDLMAAALDADIPLPIYACGFVDTAFMRLGANAVAGAPDRTDKSGGGHAYAFSKYRTNAHGEREFFLENSWGKTWGTGGGAWVSLAFIRAQWAMWIMDVRVQKAAA